MTEQLITGAIPTSNNSDEEMTLESAGDSRLYRPQRPVTLNQMANNQQQTLPRSTTRTPNTGVQAKADKQ